MNTKQRCFVMPRKYTKYPIGLTKNKTSSNMRCDRCDNLLVHSKWNGKYVIYSLSTAWNRGFCCIKCTTITRKGNKVWCTAQDVDTFMLQSMQQPAVLIQQ